MANVGWKLVVNRCEVELSANWNCCDDCRGMIWNYCCGEELTTGVSRMVIIYRTRRGRLKAKMFFDKKCNNYVNDKAVKT